MLCLNYNTKFFKGDIIIQNYKEKCYDIFNDVFTWVTVFFVFQNVMLDYDLSSSHMLIEFYIEIFSSAKMR